MRTLTPQSQHGWTRVGQVADRLPVVTQAFVRPPVPDPLPDVGLGNVAQPVHPPHNSGFDPVRKNPRTGLPRMSEDQLVRAHRRCCCARHEETHTLAEWDAIEAAQRAFAADAQAVADETADIERATNGTVQDWDGPGFDYEGCPTCGATVDWLFKSLDRWAS